ncbi:purple acid phosphatase family protein [Streptantibioticus ferralitis]|uniref:Metallophosphoesterase family protein n=1 Tax=Streptantibioticus ferralitis TaxID=236510 RepID=A0ABT5YVY5_9ACTN|nr:metallophosphoesterase family protein [Streptantibioticus ferralitis]MDF2255758.1 metallophosphoesterase family protein [Streptantibioticus ferralitis]
MSRTEPPTSRSSVTRRGLLTAAGAGVSLIAVDGGRASALPAPSPMLLSPPSALDAPALAGVHLQFGADASREVTVSWQTDVSVRRPRVMLGTVEHGVGTTYPAETRTYRDPVTGEEVLAHHARIRGLRPGGEYLYMAVHDGATPEAGTFRTAPRGRHPFTFTSFGDQATPQVNKAQSGGLWGQDNFGSPYAGDTTSAVERVAPLFHLLNGDLCYAQLSANPTRVWRDWFINNGRSARNRPWMPAAGNHENELGNGPIGFRGYQTYFNLPDSGAEDEFKGLWYAFTAGSVRVIMLQNDDVAYQDAGGSYVNGYSGGAQQRWLEQELRRTRADKDIDWIVVCMHQVVISTADFNGADLGVRKAWLPLFDRYGVDLVVCGHEHHYERSLPIRGQQGNSTATPIPVSTDLAVADTSKGTVHMVIGGGGMGFTSNGRLGDGRTAKVIVARGDTKANGHYQPVYAHEDAPWSAFRDKENPYGFCAFDVDPGEPGGRTRIHVTYYAVTGPGGTMKPVDRFTLERPRRDG